MSFDNTKYDIELNGVPHRISGYIKGEAPSFVPRVASGGQSETEFNMLLSKTLKSFAGGILQRKWIDDQTVFASEGLYPFFDDGTLYPVNAPTSATGVGGGRPYITAFAKTKDYLFIARTGTTAGPTQGISRIDTSGTIVNLTVPASISAMTYSIQDMAIWKNQLWVTANNAPSPGTNGQLYYMDLSSTTLTAIAAGGTVFHRMAVLKNQLYGTNAGTNPGYTIFRYTGDTTTSSTVELGASPGQYASRYTNLFVFNNKIILTRNDGMYAYDGTQFVTISDLTHAVDDNNFRHATVLKGYMYYFMPDGFYRYNGSIIEKLYDVSEIGIPLDVCVGKDRLWLVYTNSSVSGSSRYDRSMGYDYSSGFDVDGRVMVFNGRSMYTYSRTNTFIKSGTPLLSNEGENDRMEWFNNKLYVFKMADPSSEHFVIDTNELAATGNKTWRIVTSIFDGDFPMVDKNLENVELVVDGNVSSDQNVTVEYRISGFEGSTSWATLGTIKTITELKRQVWKSLPTGITFRQIQLRLSGTTAAGYGFSKIVLRYTLQPDFKWQWQFTVNAYGDDPTAPLVLADGTDGVQSVQTLRGNLYAARSSDLPVKFVDVDQLDLNGAINSSVTTVVLNSTSLLKGDDGFIQIDNEILYWTAKTSTNLTVVRGQLGSTAAAHSDNAKVFIVYRTLVSQLNPERITLTDNRIDQAEDKSLASQITIQLREV